MSTLAVIPARLAATRLPRKPLRLLGGRPLVVRVWERVTDLGVAERVVVATDSEEIARAVREAGGEVALTRPDHPSGTDRVAEVASRPEYAGASAILNVQGDEPFVSAAALTGALDMVRRRGFPLGTAAVEVDGSARARPEIVKVVAADDGRALYFSRAGIPFPRDGAHDPATAGVPVLQHIGVYAYAPDALARWVALPEHPLERCERLEQLRPLAAGLAMGVAVITEAPARGVDTEADLEAANARWAELHHGHR
ncbi:MAG TPA: 3-deoxy-manno-octulosonate cytidylyltransferase [Gemmatimonadaceae bacterium]|nr:3-deoxy-manno-octulosonate cytidylyltransferase [Gemmatimonadaceae bacterium]